MKPQATEEQFCELSYGYLMCRIKSAQCIRLESQAGRDNVLSSLIAPSR